jgi:hypothetical protein
VVALFALAVLGPTAAASADTVSSTTTVGGSVPNTLGLIVTSPGSLGLFTPGVADSYTTTMTATVISTAGGTALTAVDSSGSATPGHLVNSTYAPALFDLPSALEVSASGGSGTSMGLQALSGSPVTLLTYAAPVTGDSETVTFSQAIGATDALRTGSYSASVTLTLSATTP